MMSRDTAYQELLHRARYIAFEVACVWVEALGQEETINRPQFLTALNQRVMESLDEALEDAERAWNSGLEVVASVTFETTFQLAGVRAAKEAMPHVFQD